MLENGDGLEDLEFWGVAAFATNFDFLEQYGIFLQGSALLQINTTGRDQTETLSLEGIPGGTAVRCSPPPARRRCPAARSPRAPLDAGLDRPAQDDAGTTATSTARTTRTSA